MHTLLIARPDSGKSDLIKQIISHIGTPVFGYETIKEDSLAEEGKGSPIYIYEIGKPHDRRIDNLAGYCLDHHAATFPEAFDRFAPKLQVSVPAGHLIVLDEIGSMESKSPAFCVAILALLDGSVPVIAAVRDKDTPFLNTVRSHPNCKCFYLTSDNRERIFAEVINHIQEATT